MKEKTIGGTIFLFLVTFSPLPIKSMSIYLKRITDFPLNKNIYRVERTKKDLYEFFDNCYIALNCGYAALNNDYSEFSYVLNGLEVESHSLSAIAKKDLSEKKCKKILNTIYESLFFNLIPVRSCPIFSEFWKFCDINQRRLLELGFERRIDFRRIAFSLFIHFFGYKAEAKRIYTEVFLYRKSELDAFINKMVCVSDLNVILFPNDPYYKKKIFEDKNCMLWSLLDIPDGIEPKFEFIESILDSITVCSDIELSEIEECEDYSKVVRWINFYKNEHEPLLYENELDLSEPPKKLLFITMLILYFVNYKATAKMIYESLV